MNKALLGARLLLGLIFTAFGINYFVPFLPVPELPPAAGAFFGALAESGYMLPLVKITEVVGGLMLLAGLFVPLALTILAPVVVNIVLFHVFLEPSGLPMGIALVALQVFLAWGYRDAFAGVLEARSQPSA
ncbi:MAG: DoxX family membrane protein [Acidobacteriota bacterium]